MRTPLIPVGAATPRCGVCREPIVDMAGGILLGDLRFHPSCLPLCGFCGSRPERGDAVDRLSSLEADYRHWAP